MSSDKMRCITSFGGGLAANATAKLFSRSSSGLAESTWPPIDQAPHCWFSASRNRSVSDAPGPSSGMRQRARRGSLLSRKHAPSLTSGSCSYCTPVGEVSISAMLRATPGPAFVKVTTHSLDRRVSRRARAARSAASPLGMSWDRIKKIWLASVRNANPSSPQRQSRSGFPRIPGTGIESSRAKVTGSKAISSPEPRMNTRRRPISDAIGPLARNLPSGLMVSGSMTVPAPESRRPWS